ncbi:MAG TPA: hypothetical protein VFI78_06605, partial [Salinimicrobium sp.]|nr:hypothetical protein [Salinimicrobium sp.]
MKKYTLIIVGLLCLFSINHVQAQDKIYRKNGDTLNVNVTEILLDAVKYKLYNETDGPVYSLDKQRILKIVYQNGREETFSAKLMDSELYVGQKTRGLKINF